MCLCTTHIYGWCHGGEKRASGSPELLAATQVLEIKLRSSRKAAGAFDN